MNVGKIPKYLRTFQTYYCYNYAIFIKLASIADYKEQHKVIKNYIVAGRCPLLRSQPEKGLEGKLLPLDKNVSNQKIINNNKFQRYLKNVSKRGPPNPLAPSANDEYGVGGPNSSGGRRQVRAPGLIMALKTALIAIFICLVELIMTTIY